MYVIYNLPMVTSAKGGFTTGLFLGTSLLRLVESEALSGNSGVSLNDGHALWIRVF